MAQTGQKPLIVNASFGDVRRCALTLGSRILTLAHRLR